MYDINKNGNSMLNDWQDSKPSAIPAPLSIRSKGYQRVLRKIIDIYIGDDRNLLSIGSGTGIFELVLEQSGINILASDIHPASLELCKKKGLRTIKFNIINDTYSDGFQPNIIYADGVLGHLWCSGVDDSDIWRKFSSIGPKTKLLLSNDISDDNNISWRVTGMPEEKFFRPPAGWYSENAALFGWKQLCYKKIKYRRRDSWRYRELIVLTTDEQMGKT